MIEKHIKSAYEDIMNVDESNFSNEELFEHCLKLRNVLKNTYRKLESYDIALKYRTEEVEKAKCVEHEWQHAVSFEGDKPEELYYCKHCWIQKPV